jgi:hypothetical protein
MRLDADPNPTESAGQVPRSSVPRLSLPAILGTLLLVAGAVAFGVLGPRMGQRGTRIRGIPATALQGAVLDEIFGAGSDSSMEGIRSGSHVEADLDRAMATAIRDLEGILGPAVEPPLLVEAGFRLVSSRRLSILDVEAVRLDYRSEDTGLVAVLIELADPLAFVRFDDLGRQIPLVPGTRIGESIPLDHMQGGAASIGMVMLGFEGRATVVVAPGAELAVEIANLVEPGNSDETASVVEGVATILKDVLEPMTRS